MKALTGWIVAYLARWLPHRAPTGLFALGNPDEQSPVIVTANFTLTVKRVRRALAGRNVWLLVAQSEGINVWCAATGGLFNEHRIVDAIKVSRLSQRVAHRQMILPALSAPGVDREAVKRATGFCCRFGPVDAWEIAAYLEAGNKTSAAMRRFDFGPRHRLDMFLPMNFPVYLLLAVVVGLVVPRHLVGFTVLFWSAVALLYVLLDVIPAKTGWGQALLAATFVALGWAGVDWYQRGDPLAHWGWLASIFFVFFGAGFDIAGTLSPKTSDAERLMHRLGFKRFGSLFVQKETGQVQLARAKCRGCLTCFAVCPVGVFAGYDRDKKAAFSDREACFACGACVKQCPEDALSLDGG